MSADVRELVAEAAARIGRATSCSVLVGTLRGTLRGLHRMAGSDPRTVACDEPAVADRVGPCVLAMEQLTGVLVPDVTLETRWPAWGAAATAAGFRSGASLPAYVQDGVVLALNLHSELVDPWDAEALVLADTYVQQLADAVRGHRFTTAR